MAHSVRSRITLPAAFTVVAFLAIATATRADAPRVPEPVGDAALAGEQKAAALRIIHASIWEGASEHFHERHERSDLRRAARHGGKGASGGMHPRQVSPETGVPVSLSPGRPGATAQGAQSLLAVPPNARCNNPAGDGAGATQSECGVAAIGNRVVVGWNNGQGSIAAGDIQGIGASNDGGLTFTQVGPPLHPPGFPSFRWIGDPVITANEKTGDFYIAGLARTDGTHNALALARGRFTAGTFAMDSAWIVRQGLNSTTFLDKEWIACDSANGNVYLTNTTFGAADTIDFYRSTNAGRSWSSPIKLSSGADAGWVQGSRVAVAANGDVEVAWYAADQVTVEANLRFRRSTNHGVSFGSQVSPVKFNEQFGTGGPGFNRDWGPNFPSLAVDRSGGPHTGRIYLSWAECWRFLAAPVPVGPAVFDDPNQASRTFDTALPFTVGQTLRGALETSFYGVPDQDWFSFPLTAGQSVIVFADSVQVPSGWILRLVAPDGSQRLCRGGAADSSSNLDPLNPSQAYFTFTAPVSGTYLLDMLATSYDTTHYAIRTAFGTPGGERGRDQRDAFVIWSDDGITWSTPVRIDDDAPGYDLVYPELAVASDGAVYATWFDHRDDLYGSRVHTYATRSADGGATWAANARLSSAQGNFTTSASNIAPNMGDYNGVTGGGTTLVAAWGDGRATSSVDTWAASVDLTSDLTGCPGDTTMAPNSGANFHWTIANHDPVFAGDYTVALSSSRNWPLAAPGLVTVAAGGSTWWSVPVAVPDTAANGPDTLGLTLTGPAGVVVTRCSFTIHVGGSLVGADAPPPQGLELSASRPNPAAGSASIDFALPVAGRARLVVYDLTGARIRTLLDGPAPAGRGSAHWDGRTDRGTEAGPGAYFYRLEAGGRTLTRRLVLTR